MCYERGITVVPVPGAVAAVNALVASGQKTRRFAFEAFLPQDKKECASVLKDLAKERRTIVLYEAPHRLVKTLEILGETLGEDRGITVCKELTKKHESFVKTTIGEQLSLYRNTEAEPRGEYVLVIEGLSEEAIESEKRAAWESLSIEEHIRKYMDEGISKKDAVKKVAQDRGVSKRDIYSVAVEIDVE